MMSSRRASIRGRFFGSQSRHGFDSAELIRYGFTPRRYNKALEEPTGHVDPLDEFPGEGAAE